MRHSLSIEAMGQPFEVLIDGAHAADLADIISSQWRRCTPTHTSPRPHLIELTAQTPEHVAALASSLASRITIAAIDALAGTMLMLHAAGIAREGRVLALVAPSGTGKTTAAQTLGRQFGYVSDETVAVTFAGAVVPYPKPLSVGEPGSVKEQVSPDAAGLVALKSGLPLILAGIVLLDRQERGPMVPVVSDVDLLEGLAELAPQVSYLPQLPRPLHTMADVVTAAGGIHRVTYREAHTLAPALERLWSGGR